jgi:ankyrin repeat protein
VLGDLPAVQRGLTGADLAVPLPPLGWSALAYAAASSLARLDDTRPGLVATVEWLLAQGADPDTRWTDPVHPEERLPVLYGAVSRAACFETTQALLQAGADPNDNESLYHAITRGRSAAFVQLLVERGADPFAKDSLGRTPAALAARSGDVATVAYLASLGHAAPQDAQSRFLAACAAGDEVAARSTLALEPRAIKALDADALRLLPDQAQRGRLESVRLMLALGWPVAVPGDWEGSALNQAAFRGDAAMVRLLLDHGARWHESNGFGGNVVGACLHASCNMPDPAGDYPRGVVDAAGRRCPAAQRHRRPA